MLKKNFILLFKTMDFKSIVVYLATDIDILIIRVLNQSMDYEKNL